MSMHAEEKVAMLKPLFSFEEHVWWSLKEALKVGDGCCSLGW